MTGQPRDVVEMLNFDATLHVVDRADVTPPRLVSVRQVVRGRKVEAIEVTFSNPMDRATAEDTSNYAITAPRSAWHVVMRSNSPENQNPNLVSIANATYDPATLTVLLTPAGPLNSSPVSNLVHPADYQSSLEGRRTPATLTDEAGDRLDGDGDGSPDGMLQTMGSIMAYGPAKQAPPLPRTPGRPSPSPRMVAQAPPGRVLVGLPRDTQRSTDDGWHSSRIRDHAAHPAGRTSRP